jgi:hypothetical protein
MTDLSKLVVLDYETCDESGFGSTEWYRPGFKVACAAFTWRDTSGVKRSHWCRDPWLVLKELAKKQIPVAAHNLSFEMGVTEACYPEVRINWVLDTMKLALLYDSGCANEQLIEDEEAPKQEGLSLAACGRRILGQADSKAEADQLIAQLFPEAKASDYGRYKPMLPEEALRHYNIGDTELTFALADHILEAFKQEGYDWSTDMQLYINSCRLINGAQNAGIAVDRPALEKCISQVDREVAGIELKFREDNKDSINNVEEQLWCEARMKYRTEKGMANCTRPTFNIGSNRQLAMLFVDEMKCDVKFRTPTGKPSLRAAHLSQFGSAGVALQSRRKRELVGKQAQRLLELSEPNGRWHHKINPCGTVTGRFSGGGTLNIQALARRDKGFMSCLLPDEGYTLVSTDGCACEPTCTAEMSGDENYKKATLNMVGQAPYYDDSGLVIDDLYLYVASRSPLGAKLVKAAWDKDWSGKTFSQQWLEDSEVIKAFLKPTRAFHKTLTLATGYGAGPRKLATYARDCGFSLQDEEARSFWRSYWVMFPRVKELFDRMAREIKSKGYFVNPFGFRISTRDPHKAGNYLIQSSASGLLSLYALLLFEAAPWARYLVTVHDEIILQCPLDRLDELRQIKSEVEGRVNAMINWSVQVRFGFVNGSNMYEAK